jgi:hypothetical protein
VLPIALDRGDIEPNAASGEDASGADAVSPGQYRLSEIVDPPWARLDPAMDIRSAATAARCFLVILFLRLCKCSMQTSDNAAGLRRCFAVDEQSYN